MEQDIWNAHRKAWINSPPGEMGSSCPADNSRFHSPNRMVTQQKEKSAEHHKSALKKQRKTYNLLSAIHALFSSKNISPWSQSLVRAVVLVPGETGKWFTTCVQHTQWLRGLTAQQGGGRQTVNSPVRTPSAWVRLCVFNKVKELLCLVGRQLTR